MSSIYLKKSYTFGPMRLNISKSGIGVSFGVTGLRLGFGPKGAYIHAGRKGLYCKKNLSNQHSDADYEDTNMEETIETSENQEKSSGIMGKIFGFIKCLLVVYIILCVVALAVVLIIFKTALGCVSVGKQKRGVR